MSVPFKYRQHIRDLHESFHDGKPISEEELMSVIDIICPVDEQEFVVKYRAQCPLNTNGFLALMYELQKTTQIPYEEIIWRYIRGALQNGLFSAGNRMDLKTLRTTLDPMMRSVRYDIQNLYKEHNIPDSEGQITMDQLCDVFRAMYPANQIVYIEIYKWARAKKVEKSRGSIIERSKAFGGGVVSGAASTPQTMTPAGAGVASEVPKVLIRDNESATALPTSLDTLGLTPATGSKEGVATLQEILPVPKDETIKDQIQVQGDKPLESSEGCALVTSCCESPPNAAGAAPISALHVMDTDGRGMAAVTEAVGEAEKQEIPPFTSTILERNAEDMMLPIVQPATTNAMPACDLPHGQECRAGTDFMSQSAQSSKEEICSSFFPSSRPSMTNPTPKELQMEKRSGLHFNPLHIRDMEPPSKKVTTTTTTTREPLPRLRAREEEPSWEYEEVLLEAVLARVVPGQPVDVLVLEFLKDLAKQEEELQAALQIEMENLTSNMLACEIVEQRMALLRNQKQVKCFDRLESRRLELLTAMENYLQNVPVRVAQNNHLLGGFGEVAQATNKKIFGDENHSRGQPKPNKTACVSSPSPPQPLLSAERQRRATQRDHKLEVKLQQLHSLSTTPTRAIRHSAARESHPHIYHKSDPSMDVGLTKMIDMGCHPSTNTKLHDSLGDIWMPRHSVPIVHRQLPQDSRGDVPAMASAVNSGVRSFSSAPRHPARRGVNPYLTAEIAAGLLTSSQVQHGIEERLTAYLATPSYTSPFH